MQCKYILFTHLPGTLSKPPGKLMERDSVSTMKLLHKLTGILAMPNNPGMLVVFNESGWLPLLSTVGADFDPMKLGEEFAQIDAQENFLRDLLWQLPKASEFVGTYNLERVEGRTPAVLPDSGESLVVVGLINDGLHIRIFDAGGEMVVDKTEVVLSSGLALTELKTTVRALKTKACTNEETEQIVKGARFVAGYTIPRVRLVTAKDLYPIVNNLRGDKLGHEATRLRRFLVSEDEGVRYDTAKVVEALIRIRHVGSGIPVIRIDWDALLNQETLEKDLQASLLSIRQRCEQFANEPLIQSSMLSCGYSGPDSDLTINQWKLSDYNTAFATRVFPALIPTDEAISWLNRDVTEDRDGNKIDGELAEADIESLGRPDIGFFDAQVVKKYYGLDSGTTRSWEGIARVGAHPNESVISGALLALSDGAILDLPPFSNFRRNVMWIDDHLKYLLHQALGHFRRMELDIEGEPFKPRVEGGQVFKDRVLAGQGNLRPYTLGNYIPTVFWGTILDAWIQDSTAIKPPVVEKLTTESGPFAESLAHALRRSSFPQEEQEALREELLAAAWQRADEVHQEWRALRSGSGEDAIKSFAALWATGDRKGITRALGKLADRYKRKKDWIGWGMVKKGSKSISGLDDLSPEVEKGIRILVDDVITYIEWALEWPSFVRSVRAVRFGTLSLDASWEPGNLLPTDP